MKLRFIPFDAMYKIEGGMPVIYMYGRTVEGGAGGKQVCVIDRTPRPYFWVKLTDETRIKLFEEKVRKLSFAEVDARVVDTEIAKKNIDGKEHTLVKVFANIPGAVPTLREVIKQWEMVASVNEADILFARRYLIDRGIIPSTVVELEVEEIESTNKVATFELVSITEREGEEGKRKEGGKETRVKEEEETRGERSSIPKTVSPRILAVDIETYCSDPRVPFDPKNNPIIMLALYGENFQKVLTYKQFETAHKYIEFVEDEASLLTRFLQLVEEYAPDILVGYNSDGFDLPYIRQRAQVAKVHLPIGLDGMPMRMGRGQRTEVRLSGIVHLDLLPFMRKVMSWSLKTDSMKLDSVSEELLGEKKIDINIEDMFAAWREGVGLEIFCEYNLRDTYLTYELTLKVLPLIEEFVKIVGLPMHDVSRMSFSQLVEWYILKRTLEFNEIAPNKPGGDEIRERQRQRLKGAFVFEPKAGVYDNVVVYDFRSLYPTIISSHNISSATLNCQCCEAEKKYVPNTGDKYWLCQKTKGFLPTVIEDLIKIRMKIKEQLKHDSGNQMLNARSQAVKLLCNSFYGYFAFYASRWYSFGSGECTTAYGRFYVKDVIEKAKEHGFEVLYADTDSVFFTLGGQEESASKKFADEVNDSLPGLMELEFEGLYPAGIFVLAKDGSGAKKKYAMLREDGSLKIRGFETVRRNWSQIAKETQEKVLRILLKDKDEKAALGYVKGVVSDIKDKKVPSKKMIIFTKLQREVEEYTANTPHVAIAQRMKDLGMSVGPGTMVQYVITPGKGPLRDKVKLPNEVLDNNYDSTYYVTHQVVPAVSRIFSVFGYEEEELLGGRKQEKLSKFFG